MKDKINSLREKIDNIARQVKDLHPHVPFPRIGIDAHEAHANVTLAYRHLEDARMRLGKVIQSLEGGNSCYNNQAPVVRETRSHEGEPAPSPF